GLEETRPDVSGRSPRAEATGTGARFLPISCSGETPLRRSSEGQEVVRHHAEVTFSFPGGVRAPAQGGAEKPWVRHKGASHRPALPVFPPGEVLVLGVQVACS